MNNLVKVVLVGCAVLGLAACGVRVRGESDAPPKVPVSTGSTASTGSGTTAPAVPVNERGFVVRQLGEMGCFGGTGNDCVGGVSFAIDQVEVDPPCMEFGSHPDDGHTLLLHVRVTTGDDTEAIDEIRGIINPLLFVEIGKDGVTRRASFGMCADPMVNRLPDTYGPNQQYAGVLDVAAPEASGTIALQLAFPDDNGQRGWEWTYPV